MTPSRPLNARSLNARLLLFAGGATAGALVVAWLVLGLLFERHAERQLQAELERHGLALIAALDLDAQGRPTLSTRPFDPRFERPASGLYWRISAPGGDLRSRSLWDGALARTPSPPSRGWRTFNTRGPFEPRIMAIVRDVQPDRGGPQALIEVAADRGPLTEARAAFGLESAVFLAVLWLALGAAAWIQVRLGLAPLERVRQDLDAMRRRPDARMDDESHPVEIRPLTQAVNDLAEARAQDVERARRRARDLAHALKTPLTALRLQIDALPPDVAREMAHGLSLVSGAVEGELARTGERSTGAGADASSVVERLFAVISRTPDGARLALENHLPADLRSPLDEAAALEVLGALLENAARHAEGRVTVTGAGDAGAVRIEIADDGAGIAPEARDTALSRGGRLDEGGARHGLGLAIARDFVEASGGSLSLDDAEGGGLRVVLVWTEGEAASTA